MSTSRSLPATAVPLLAAVALCLGTAPAMAEDDATAAVAIGSESPGSDVEVLQPGDGSESEGDLGSEPVDVAASFPEGDLPSGPPSPGTVTKEPENLENPEDRTFLTVEKEWVIDGREVAHADRPAGFDAAPTVDGHVAAFGTRGEGYRAGGTVEIGEDVTLPDRCTLVEVAGSGTVTLTRPETSVALRSTVECATTLTLTLDVRNGTAGTAGPGDWELTATPEDDSTAHSDIGSAVRVNGAAADRTLGIAWDVPYSLTSSMGPDDYTLTELSCRPAGAGSWTPLRETLTVDPGSATECRFVSAFQGLELHTTASQHGVALPAGGDLPPGDVTWSCTVTNTGATALSGIAVQGDTLTPGTVACPATTLAPGASMECSTAGPDGQPLDPHGP